MVNLYNCVHVDDASYVYIITVIAYYTSEIESICIYHIYIFRQ